MTAAPLTTPPRTDRAPNRIEQEIERLKNSEAELLAEARIFRNAIENMEQSLKSRVGSGPILAPQSHLPPVTPNQYKGMRTGEALASYMRARPGQRIPIDRVIEDLRTGGAEMGQYLRHKQNLRITMRAKPKLVQWDEGLNNLWLAPTASDPPPRRMRPNRKPNAR
jgi:hypothetical protein